MVTTLYLIRHGETEGSNVKRYKGSMDVPLSENGIRQMEHVAKYLSQDAGHIPPTHPSPSRGEGEGGGESHANKLAAVYCSDLSRALKSAEIIAVPSGLKPVVIEDLRERSFGIWEGMSFTEIKERYPEEFEAWAGNPLRYSPIGGESTIEVKARVIKALDEILNGAVEQQSNRTENDNNTTVLLRYCATAPNPNIAIVAHGGVNRIILCHVMGIPLENIFRIEQDFGAVNIIEFHDKYPVVKLINGGVNVY
ncbi:MAG: histidine phosphatase family protein [Thermodesulfovibrionales bacterium]|nr:histidine phosphatase family protein [Thermodesulfovibrionales bacterium]